MFSARAGSLHGLEGSHYLTCNQHAEQKSASQTAQHQECGTRKRGEEPRQRLLRRLLNHQPPANRWNDVRARDDALTIYIGAYAGLDRLTAESIVNGRHGAEVRIAEHQA